MLQEAVTTARIQDLPQDTRSIADSRSIKDRNFAHAFEINRLILLFFACSATFERNKSISLFCKVVFNNFVSIFLLRIGFYKG